MYVCVCVCVCVYQCAGARVNVCICVRDCEHYTCVHVTTRACHKLSDSVEQTRIWTYLQRTSLDLMRYRTSRPLNTASVWLSKSGGLMPEKRRSFNCSDNDYYSKCRLNKQNHKTAHVKYLKNTATQNNCKILIFIFINKY